jgi:hypothetical protein
MSIGSFFEPLVLHENFIKNINDNREQNNNETKVNIYKNSHTMSSRKDDTNFNSYNTNFYEYKNKSFFGRSKPIQTEHDEIGVNQAYLNKHFGYTDYGTYLGANQSMKVIHKTTPKNNLYDLF